ncbi:hypothetical protein Pcac1_g7836 [Phytophthora cactorum]|nr:hypothetical protein Pcac1_g7836 [Phytophthora cactorum]
MDGPMRGPEVVLTYWRLFSLSFDDICVETERLDKRVESNTLVVTTATSVTISKDTLRLVFPHLDSNKKGLVPKRSCRASLLLRFGCGCSIYVEVH